MKGNLKAKQTKVFAKQKKKLHPKQIVHLDAAIKRLMEDPELGQQKKGDLRCVRVYKYKIKAQQFLLAYQLLENEIILLALRSHENFYKKLKR